MCARFLMTSAPEAVRELFRYAGHPNFPPRPEIFPSEPIAIVTGLGDHRHFRLARWGYLPGWARDPKAFKPLINARIETANDKPSFRGAMRHNRCLIPADGFYEWSGEGRGGRTRHTITPAGGGPIAFAGLWGDWMAPDGSEIDGAAILTCDAGPDIAPVHDRMPVIVPPDLFDVWLDVSGVSGAEAAAAVRARPGPRLVLDPPSRRPSGGDAAPHAGPPPSQLDFFSGGNT